MAIIRFTEPTSASDQFAYIDAVLNLYNKVLANIATISGLGEVQDGLPGMAPETQEIIQVLALNHLSYITEAIDNQPLPTQTSPS